MYCGNKKIQDLVCCTAELLAVLSQSKFLGGDIDMGVARISLQVLVYLRDNPVLIPGSFLVLCLLN